LFKAFIDAALVFDCYGVIRQAKIGQGAGGW
jgi:hypothetical protein